MRNMKVGFAALVGLGFGLACSGIDLPSRGSHQNVSSCKAYVEAFNGASCNTVDMDSADLCPETLDMMSCDMSQYYECMATAVKCNGDFLDISGQSNCSMPPC